MRTSELDFDLPRELIATEPASPRDSARMLVVSRSDPTLLEHRVVRDLPMYLAAGDRVVFNATRVVPARLQGVNVDTGGKVQGLYLSDEGRGEDGRLRWEAMIKARRFRAGRRIELIDAAGERTGVVITLIERADEEEGSWLVSVEPAPGMADETPAILARAGHTPLPPYILSARRERGEHGDDARDREDYQTVFAKKRLGSVAAPTAGLHFTPELLARLDAMGVERAEVELSVGSGTFKPVETEMLEDHPMHFEWCSLGEAGPGVLEFPVGRLIAVGTTTVRTLETFAKIRQSEPVLPEFAGTRLLIKPGYEWLLVEGLVTNFHLPHSTLLALVAGLFEGGMGRVREIYAEAIRERYRFFSYGDAMLVLP
ncbi:MAG: tRNA preQ1(34) S-adenosylmethionine ribosyltransferase-isomerase QueA [Phycisphaerales bacterium]